MVAQTIPCIPVNWPYSGCLLDIRCIWQNACHLQVLVLALGCRRRALCTYLKFDFVCRDPFSLYCRSVFGCHLSEFWHRDLFVIGLQRWSCDWKQASHHGFHTWTLEVARQASQLYIHLWRDRISKHVLILRSYSKKLREICRRSPFADSVVQLSFSLWSNRINICPIGLVV